MKEINALVLKTIELDDLPVPLFNQGRINPDGFTQKKYLTIV
mgnify:CR=1 FL=1